MELCVSRKWSARVSHWLYRWATHCCPRLPWCQRKCHISWEELEKKKAKNTETRLAFQICNLWFIHLYHLYVISHYRVKGGMMDILTVKSGLCSSFERGDTAHAILKWPLTLGKITLGILYSDSMTQSGIAILLNVLHRGDDLILPLPITSFQPLKLSQCTACASQASLQEDY